MKNQYLLAFFLLPLAGTSQTEIPSPGKQFPKIHISQKPEHIARLKEINRDILTPFAEAYSVYDAEKYLGLHTPDFIRANGGERAGMNDLEGYRRQVTNGFERGRSSGRRTAIAFSFFERSAGEKTASERGIYRYTSIAPEGGSQHFYGKFHVFHRKIDGIWKIAVDYDSNEDGSVGVEDFDAGLPPNRFGCITDAIALDDSLGRARNHACARISLSQTILQYAASIENIGAGCPAAFATGFKKHREAWLALLPVTDRYPDLRGEMHALFKQLESGKDGAQFKSLVKSVWDTWSEIEAAMQK